MLPLFPVPDGSIKISVGMEGLRFGHLALTENVFVPTRTYLWGAPTHTHPCGEECRTQPIKGF